MAMIGLVGPFGSGCSFIGKIICKDRNFKYISLSKTLKDLYFQENDVEPNRRSDLQDFGDKVRQQYGNSVLAEKVWDEIKNDTNSDYIIDSFRHPDEVNFFRKRCSNFYLFGIFADYDIRWKRTKELYDDNERDFKCDDSRDSGENFSYGQKVSETFQTADIVFQNNLNVIEGNEDYATLQENIRSYINVLKGSKAFMPTPDETYMTMAYAASMRSSCLKRKVGAVIVDDMGNVFSSGYNEVPFTQRSCKKDYGQCYRDKLKSDFKQTLRNQIEDQTAQEKVYKTFKGSFKILDYCRALHAEENAILNVARIGASSALNKATLYTTTYPCNLCANKIAQVGIKKIVYFEPYPMKEAKKILEKQGVKQTPFEGATYSGYFRLMEVIK